MVLDLQNASELAKLLPAKRSFKLAFTSGCFDLLHPGHIHLFASIKETVSQDTRLLVVSHSDSEISARKGPHRPVFYSKERIQILDSVRYVDLCGIWNGWESIIELVEMLKPEYLATTSDKIASATWQKNWTTVADKLHSQLISVPLLPNQESSSQILARLSRIDGA